MVGKNAEDVEMKDVSSPSEAEKKVDGKEKEEEKKDPELLTLEGETRNKHVVKYINTTFLLYNCKD